MIEVTVTSSGGGPTFPFGPKVENLEQAKVLVETLEWMYQLREEIYKETQERLAIDWLPALDYLEGSDVYATDEQTGRIWSYEDKWELFHPGYPYDRVITDEEV